MEFTRYYGKYKYENRSVLQKFVIQKGKTLQIRIDSDLLGKLKELADELGQSDSKVARDILEDFFLTQKLTRQKEDVEHFLNN